MTNRLFYSQTDGWAYPETFRAIPRGSTEITVDQCRATFAGESAVALHLRGWRLIQRERDALKAGGVLVAGKWFHTDADSRIQYLGLKDSARDLMATGGALSHAIVILGKPVYWRTMDGSFVAVTAQLTIEIVSAVGDLDARAFAVAEAHHQALIDAEEPALYDFSAGWPATYEG